MAAVLLDQITKLRVRVVCLLIHHGSARRRLFSLPTPQLTLTFDQTCCLRDLLPSAPPRGAVACLLVSPPVAGGVVDRKRLVRVSLFWCLFRAPRYLVLLFWPTGSCLSVWLNSERGEVWFDLKPCNVPEVWCDGSVLTVGLSIIVYR